MTQPGTKLIATLSFVYYIYRNERGWHVFFFKGKYCRCRQEKNLAEFNYCDGGFEIKFKLLFYEEE